MRYRPLLSLPAILFALTLLMVGTSPVSAQVADSAHVNHLLTNAEHYSNLAADDAEILESFTRSNVGWQSHSGQLERIRENVNKLGKVVQQLNQARGEASPWQQTAIDTITPLMHEIATQLTTTIEHLNANQSRIEMKPYQDYTRATYEAIRRATLTISDYVEYGRAKGKAENLQQEMELPPSGPME
jgi:hypothetical protein